MTLEDFKQKVAVATDESDIDGLCFAWFKSLCEDYGEDGKIAFDLLKIIERIFNQSF
jgi:hypothetical protein